VYGMMFLASLLQLREPEDRGLRLFLLLASFGGLGFSLYLTSIEAFILHTWCVLCLTSQATILLIVGSTVTLWRRGRIPPGTQPIVHGN